MTTKAIRRAYRTVRVPDFYNAAAVDRRDFTTKAGAEDLAAIIRAKWRACGHQVLTVVEPVTGRPNSGYMVRSNLIGGLPQSY